MIILEERQINDVDVKVLFNRYMASPYKVVLTKNGKARTKNYKTMQGVEKLIASL